MERPDAYKDRLAKLECHFLWCPDVGGKTESLESIIDKIENGIRESPSMSLPSLALLSYLYTVNSQKTNPDKALDCIEKAKTLHADPSFDSYATCDFVLKVNELHVQNRLYSRSEERLSQLEKEWSERELKPKWEAAVWGAKGYAMSRFGLPKYNEGIDAYQKARKLDKYNPHWFFGQGFLLCRQNKACSGTLYKPSDEEKWLLWKANEFGNYQDALHMSVYAQLLCTLARLTKCYNEQSLFLKECLRLTDKAMCYAGVNQCIYWRCAKINKQCGFWDKFKECLIQGIDKCTIKDQLYHALANVYWRNTKERDLPKAHHYMCKSIAASNSGQGYFWAQLDLLRLKIDMDKSFDPLKDFACLEAKCSTDLGWKAALYKHRGIYLLQKGNDDMAIDEFLKAVELESNQKYGQVFDIRDELEKLLEGRITTDGERPKILQLALFYQNYKPGSKEYFIKSAHWYQRCYDSDHSDEFTTANYGFVLIQLQKYSTAIEVLDRGHSCQEIKYLSALAHFKAAEQATSNFVKEKHFRRCVALHCKNGAEGLLNFLKDGVKDNQSLAVSMNMFHDCVSINQVINDPRAISLKTEPKVPDKQIIQADIRELLGLDIEGPLKELKQLRYDMSCDPGSKMKNDHVLCNARYQLDRAHKQFGKKHFPKGKAFCGFPRAVKTGCIDKESVKKELSRLIQSPKESHGGWENFAQIQGHRFKPLLDFLAEKQIAASHWLKGWFDLINIHKHDRELISTDYQIVNTSGNAGDPYELAHQAAEFAEQVVTEYQKYM